MSGEREREAARIRAAYAERDAAPMTAYREENPGYQLHMRNLEGELSAALRRAGFDLRGASVLEVGAGFGDQLARLRRLGADSGTGVDLSASRMQAARERHPRLRFLEADASALPFEDASFDLVVQFVCLSSVLDAGVRRAIAAEMWRVARPGGAVLSYDLRPTPRAVQAAGRLLLRRELDAATPTRPLSADELRALFPGRMDIRTVSLNFELATAVSRSRAAVAGLRALPFLRTHHLAVARR